jgi:CRP/FNR family transcriptional regulator, cyclic AMP receptor protein
VSDRKLEMLRSVELFAECTDVELRTVAATADMIRVDAGELLRDGAIGPPSFYLILDGTAALGSDALLGPGDWDGAIPLLGGESDTDDLRMLSDGVVLIAGPREFGGLLAAVPGFASGIGRELTRRLRDQHRRNFAA